MIKYHGTPISGSELEASRFLKRRHALVPFFAAQHLAVCLEQCESVILDCSAFTIWRRGGVLDIDKYREWVRAVYRHPRFTWALIPDVIDGEAWENDMHIALWPDDLPGVPVFHLHENPDRLARLVETHGTVALGSSGRWRTPGTSEWWDRMEEIMPSACDEAGCPKAKLHGLRMLNPEIFRYLPLTSADSANAGINAGSKKRFGQYVPPSASVRAAMIADRVEEFQSAAVWAGRPG